MKTDKCDETYDNVVNITGASNDTLFRLAQCFISGYDIGKLKAMLRSNNDGIILDGLFVCKEIGSLVCELHECIHQLQANKDPDLRNLAKEVLGLCELYSQGSH